MITIISGGKYSLRLISGLRSFLNDDEITVISDTSDSFTMSGGIVSHNIDNLLFLFSGILNTNTWAGIAGDTYSTDKFLERMNHPEYYETGDRERGLQIARAEMIRSGLKITEITREFCSDLGITATIIPATERRISAAVKVGEVSYSPAEYRDLVNTGELKPLSAESVMILSAGIPYAAQKAINAIISSEFVIIGPGDYATSVLPVLACRGMVTALKSAKVISLLPRMPDKYPECREAVMYDRTVALCRRFSDIIIQDIKEETEISGTMKIHANTGTKGKNESLAWDIMSIGRGIGRNLR
ncbi:2-phospho-L-lactate transferase CofD family protein [Methanoplanus endosymbiosus]|uniref:2-phospho-L-lactate transferase CofD family protein n=1 Tax=Methanoplanus endosymbiosus TaxID=33865 RepID=A0A9E7PM49_9EURY|nr:2-phospho-L-lactate transferase CofD family protein [Methanoplanus endosymbiosus]UUX92735.1 2-phospho-L-lactate transferase CofD family protein [Methanoplanus endosymbiosus]